MIDFENIFKFINHKDDFNFALNADMKECSKTQVMWACLEYARDFSSHPYPKRRMVMDLLRNYPGEIDLLSKNPKGQVLGEEILLINSGNTQAKECLKEMLKNFMLFEDGEIYQGHAEYHMNRMLDEIANAGARLMHRAFERGRRKLGFYLLEHHFSQKMNYWTHDKNGNSLLHIILENLYQDDIEPVLKNGISHIQRSHQHRGLFFGAHGAFNLRNNKNVSVLEIALRRQHYHFIYQMMKQQNDFGKRNRQEFFQYFLKMTQSSWQTMPELLFPDPDLFKSIALCKEDILIYRDAQGNNLLHLLVHLDTNDINSIVFFDFFLETLPELLEQENHAGDKAIDVARALDADDFVYRLAVANHSVSNSENESDDEDEIGSANDGSQVKTDTAEEIDWDVEDQADQEESSSSEYDSDMDEEEIEIERANRELKRIFASQFSS